jgi:hypothetical protein
LKQTWDKSSTASSSAGESFETARLELTLHNVLAASGDLVPPLAEPTLPERLVPALLEDLREHARLSELGSLGALSELAHAISTHRDVAHVTQTSTTVPPAPEAPVIVAGLPRTGTTVLHHLLVAGLARARAPLAWEVAFPTLGYAGSQYRDLDEAVAKTTTAARLDLLTAVGSRVLEMHPMTFDSIEECTPLLATSLMSPQVLMMFRAPRFREWLLDQDLSEPYSLWRIQLGMITSRVSGPTTIPWVLKSPLHVFDYAALWEAIPSARVIQIQRSAVDFFESFLNLVEAARSIFSDHVDPAELGAEWLEFWSTVVPRAQCAVAANPTQLFVVDYEHLVRDPLRVLNELSLELDVEIAIAADELRSVWAAQRSLHTEYGRKSLDYFGLHATDVTGALSPNLGRGLVA